MQNMLLEWKNIDSKLKQNSLEDVKIFDYCRHANYFSCFPLKFMDDAVNLMNKSFIDR